MTTAPGTLMTVVHAVVRWAWATLFGVTALLALAFAPWFGYLAVSIALFFASLAVCLIRSRPGKSSPGRIARSFLAVGMTSSVLLGLGTAFGVVRWNASPEIPENAIIRFGMSHQVGDDRAARSRVCESRIAEYDDRDSQFYAAVVATDGLKGLSDYPGWETKVVDSRTAIVYGSAFVPGRPSGRKGFTAPEDVWAATMVRESGLWRLCDLQQTGQTVSGFDIRIPCFPGEAPDLTEAVRCRVDS